MSEIRNLNRGFTLVEMIVVVTIIGILSASAMALYSGASGRARNAARDNDIRQMVSSARFVKANFGVYPKNAVEYYNMAPEYISHIPFDPLSTRDINRLGAPLSSYSEQEYTYSYFDPPQSYSDERIMTSAYFESDKANSEEKNGTFGRYKVGTMHGPTSLEMWSQGVPYSVGQTNPGTIILKEQ